VKGVVLALCGLAIPSFGQIDFGVTGGIPFSNIVKPYSLGGSPNSGSGVDSAARRYTAGAYIEWRFHGALGLETGTLFRRFGFDSQSYSGFFPRQCVRSSTTGNSWEIPVLAKAHLRIGSGVRAYIGGGPTVRRFAGIREAGVRTVVDYTTNQVVTTTPYSTSDPPGMAHRNSIGATFGAGLEMRTGRIHWSPGVRVTRWDAAYAGGAAPPLTGIQVDGLLSIAYSGSAGASERAWRPPGSFEVGIIAGAMGGPAPEVEANPYSVYSAPTRHFAGGALLDWRLSPRWSAEGSFVVHRIGQQLTACCWFNDAVAASQWDVPVLARWRPFRGLSLGAGPSFRQISNTIQVTDSQYGRLQSASTWYWRSGVGGSAAAAIEVPAGRIRLRSEVRYTVYGTSVVEYSTLHYNRYSLMFLLGITNRTHMEPRR
jgi:hypothetical protein